MSAFVRPPNSTETRHEHGPYIARAFVPLPHRGKGVGKLLTKLVLSRIFDGTSIPKDYFHGVGFCYGLAAAGRGVFGPKAKWIDRRILEWDTSSDVKEKFAWKPIRDGDLEGIIKADVSLIGKEVAALPISDTVRIRIVPSWDSFQMRLEGYKVNNKVFGYSRTPQIWGASIGDSSQPSTWAFAIWIYSPCTNTIDIDRIRAPNMDYFETLMAASASECEYWGATRCHAFGVPHGFKVNDICSRISEVDLPGIHVMGYDNSMEVEWLENEGFTDPTWVN